MVLQKDRTQRILFIIEIITSIYWMTFLINTDSYYVVYLLIGVLGSFCWYQNRKESILPPEGAKGVIGLVIAALISLAVVCANYGLFETYFAATGRGFQYIYASISAVFVFVGGFFLLWNILKYSAVYCQGYRLKHYEYSLKPEAVFGMAFVFTTSIYLIIFFLFNYPGTITPDSVHQLREIMANEYSNHHPFYSTMLIKVFFDIGRKLFNDINGAVAVYSVFQAVFMAAGFAYLTVTLYQMKVSAKVVMGTALIYTFLPYNIAYSTTMRKDALFAIFMLILIVAFFRITEEIGCSMALNYGMLVLGGMGVCLFRNNGWPAFILCAVTFLLLFRGKHKKLVITFIAVAIASFIMKGPVLNMLQVSEPDILESLAIPIQQIARVITDGDDLTKEQEAILSQVVDIDRVEEAYLPYFVDPLKNLIREKNNVKLIKDHSKDFIKLYIELGLSHPVEYLKAWIDQTRGYWNGGYNYWRWEHGVQENSLGIFRTEGSYLFSRLMYEYLWIFQVIPMLYILLCIGFFVWLTMYLMYLAMIRGNKKVIVMAVPLLGNIATLLAATPVFAEFRYAYSIFVCIPFLAFALFYERGQNYLKEE